ncbi:MAG: hypothetical protein GC129_02390 [Proteobacteria bacterium]|nr:hypothetical protein [Pseudomonadota bacterium]
MSGNADLVLSGEVEWNAVREIARRILSPPGDILRSGPSGWLWVPVNSAKVGIRFKVGATWRKTVTGERVWGAVEEQDVTCLELLTGPDARKTQKRNATCTVATPAGEGKWRVRYSGPGGNANAYTALVMSAPCFRPEAYLLKHLNRVLRGKLGEKVSPAQMELPRENLLEQLRRLLKEPEHRVYGDDREMLTPIVAAMTAAQLRMALGC